MSRLAPLFALAALAVLLPSAACSGKRDLIPPDYGPVPRDEMLFETQPTKLLEGREELLTHAELGGDRALFEPDFHAEVDGHRALGFLITVRNTGKASDFEAARADATVIAMKSASDLPASAIDGAAILAAHLEHSPSVRERVVRDEPVWWVVGSRVTDGPFPSEYRLAFLIPEKLVPAYPASTKIHVYAKRETEHGDPAELELTRGAVANVLVLGDSVVWGQGNQESEKFTTRVASRWAAAARTPLRMYRYAHSGAVVTGPDSPEQCPSDPVFNGEVSKKDDGPEHRDFRIPCQLEAFRRRAGNPPIDWVLTDGCANDVRLDAAAGWILLPVVFRPLQGLSDASLVSENLLHERISNHCDARMQLLLRDLRDLKGEGFWHGDPRVVVSGYYSPLSELSLGANLHDFVERLAGKGIGPNFSFDSDKKEALKRAQFWQVESDQALARAARRVDPKRIAFAPVDFGGDYGYGGQKQAIFDFFFSGRDSMADDRVKSCEAAGRAGDRHCLEASVIHPNAQGEKLYADSVYSALGKLGAIPAARAPAWTGFDDKCAIAAVAGECGEQDSAGNCLLTRFQRASLDCPK
jgi:hypothetical protein